MLTKAVVDKNGPRMRYATSRSTSGCLAAMRRSVRDVVGKQRVSQFCERL
ncbi:MAG: hypothetical protein RDU59_05585 [Thermodesulfobacteriota bacterium]|nr:hypothetical protein [Thermodesulfobacteriota bacterium]